MLPVERHRRILQILETELSASVSVLQERLEVNPMTLWRDLKKLEEEGLLKRIRGGAMRVDVAREPRFDTKLKAERGAKGRIAAYAAAKLVRNGDIIALEGGTTVVALAQRLKQRDLTILTNSIPILNEVRIHSPRATVYCSGGLLREESGTLVGKESVTFFSRRKVGTFFMGATGLDPESGLTDPNPQEIEVKQAMARAAGRIVLLLDTGKMGQHSLMEVLPLKKIDIAVCEKTPPPAYRTLFKKNGIRLLTPKS